MPGSSKSTRLRWIGDRRIHVDSSNEDDPLSVRTTPLEGLLAGLRLGLGAGAGDPEADVEALSRIAEWDAAATLARRHRVAPLLLQGMRARAAGLLSASGIEPGLERARDQAVRNGLAQLAALRRATGLLTAGDIPCLVLKGLPLGQRSCGNPLVRHQRDIDLLVSPRKFPAAERVLLENGWRRVEPKFRETPARNRWYARFRHEHKLAGPGGLLELHRRLSYNPFYFDAPFESLHAGSVPVEIGADTVRALGEDDEVVYLVCHGARHYWKRLKWLYDVAALLVSMEPERFERVWARCRQGGLEYVLASTLLLCREAFHVRVPRGASPLPTGGRRTVWIAGFSRRTWAESDPARFSGGFDWAGQKVIGLIAKPDFRTVAYELASVAVAPRDWKRLDLPDWLFYLYFPLRPLLWLTRGKRSRKRTDAAEAKDGGHSSSRRAGERRPLSAGPEARRSEADGSGKYEVQVSAIGATSRKAPSALPSALRRTGSILHLGELLKALRAFTRAPVAVKAMALEAALFLLLAWLLVKYVPMRHWRHRLATAEDPAPAGGPPANPHAAASLGDPEEPEPSGGSLPRTPERRLPRRAARVVRRVARHVPFPAVCLPQAMTLQWMLRRRGVKSGLVFGARRKAQDTGLDFHAWLTVGGECVIGGGEIGTYTALPPFDDVGLRPG